MTGAKTDDLLRPFAQSIYAKVMAYRDLEAALTNSQAARFRESISDDIKKCSNFITPDASRAALREASSLGVNLYKMNWHDQGRFDAGRKLFHFEHVNCVKDLQRACLKETTHGAILDILKTRIRVAWILKSEDACLSRLGYRSDRPDPSVAYKEAGIELVVSPA
jgi:hypothetical protein